MPARLVWLIALAVLSFCARPGAARAGETPLPDFARAAAWRGESGVSAVAEEDGWLRLKARAGSADSARLLLHRPLPLPDGHELVWRGAASDIRSMFLYVLVRDAGGREYRVFQESRSFCRGSMFLNGFFDAGLHRHGDVLFRTKGFRGFPGESFAPLTGDGRAAPRPPLVLLGLEFRGEAPEAVENTFYFRDFRLTAATAATEKLYYQFAEQECFGSLCGAPSLSYGDILDMEGVNAADALVDWSVRADYAGAPFLEGGGRCDLAGGNRTLRLTGRVEFPVRRPGTYWVRVKYRARSPEKKVYRTEERDYRLYVIRGGESPLPAPVTSGRPAGGGLVRLAPGVKNLVVENTGPWPLSAAFYDAAGARCALAVRDGTGKVLAETAADVPQGESERTLRLDLDRLPAGIYRATAVLTRAGAEVDRATRDIARRPAADTAPYALPRGVRTAKQLLAAEKPLAYFDAHLDETEGYVAKVKLVMDAVRPITADFEIRANWHDIERLPGAYDFSVVDALLDHAAANGSRIQPLVSFHAPEWAPSHYTENPAGEIFGHNTYLFHGARLNTWQSPEIRAAALRFVEALVRHCRRHPAVQSYYFLIEHPGEAPYKGWYEGFDRFTLANFREAMKKKHGTVARANAAWRTSFADFASVRPPLPGARAANALWLDWMTFREDGVESFREEYVNIVRRLDPERMVMSYGNGTPGMRGKGVFTANGGCAVPEVAARDMAMVADRGTPQRAEEITVTQWTDYPYRLDDSLFTMMHGGGMNAHCKMFFPVKEFLQGGGRLDALRRPPHGLDRFEKFLPLWAELHSGVRENGDEVRYFTDRDCDLLTRKTTFFGGGDPWNTRLFLDAQVPFGVAPGRDWEKARLLVLHDSLLRALKDSTREALARYVENGGGVLMFAASGRYSIERGDSDGGLLFGHTAQNVEREKAMNAPENDWLLLKRFGFAPPAPACRQGLVARLTLPGDRNARLGAVRDLWTAPADAGETVAVCEVDGREVPAVTRRACGRGRVYVIWAQAVLPADEATARDGSLLRTVAAACGARPPAAAADRRFWTVLLRHPGRDVRHLLVMRGGDGPAERRSSPVRLPLLPDGRYRVTELLHGAAGETTGAELRDRGVVPALEPREVAVYRIEALGR